MPRWQSLFAALREENIDVSEHDMPRPVGGGDISAAWRANADHTPVFLKTGPVDRFDMFLAEAAGLRELAAARAVRVPRVLGCVSSGGECILALEWIDFQPGDVASERELGARLAKLHRHRKDRFGWDRDNTIGSTPQKNAWSNDWVGFFRDQRLAYQFELAAKNGFDGALQMDGRRLLESLGLLFDGYWPEASLLHGDLWGGNWAAADNEPVIFDPAVYYGDRETDLAMTRLFGGFGHTFYEAYEAEWPLAAGHERRTKLYQLYHVLNHLNLFGASYLNRAHTLIRALL